MREVLLLAVIAVFMIFGYFVMGKTDDYIDENSEENISYREESEENNDRIL